MTSSSLAHSTVSAAQEDLSISFPSKVVRVNSVRVWAPCSYTTLPLIFKRSVRVLRALVPGESQGQGSLMG